MMISRVLVSLLAVVALAPASVVAETLDQKAQREVVAHLEVALRQNYVFPERMTELRLS